MLVMKPGFLFLLIISKIVIIFESLLFEHGNLSLLVTPESYKHYAGNYTSVVKQFFMALYKVEDNPSILV